jgi:hypothetical protein
MLKRLDVLFCNMNARGDSFHLEEDEYPKGLEEVHAMRRGDRIGPATNYRVARSPRLYLLRAGAEYSAVVLILSAVDGLCGILSRKTFIYKTSMLPRHEL